MAVPYSQTISQYLDNHTYIKSGNSWRTVEDVRIKSGGTWRDVKTVYIKSGNSWRTVHEGDHFLFNYTDSSNSQSELTLSSILSNAGYSSGSIKGAITINCKRKRLNLGNYSGKVYLRVNSNKKISGSGGNGGQAQGGAGGGQSRDTGGGGAGASGAAIRRTSGFSVSINNSGTIQGSTTATGTS